MRREPVRLNAVIGLMLVYLVVQVASAEFSADVTASFPALAVFSLQGIVLYFLILNTVRTHAQLQRCLWAMVLAGVLLGTLSFIQRVTHAYKKDFGGFAASQTFDRPVGIGDAAATRRAIGRQAVRGFVSQLARHGIPGRSQLLCADHGCAGAHCASATLGKPWLACATPALLALAAILCGVVLSYSRGAIVALCALVAALIAFRYLRLRYVCLLCWRSS